MYKRLLMTLAGLSLLAGCGGGEGGSFSNIPAAYTGKTTQATVTTANAKALSADAYSGSQFSSAVSGIAKTADAEGDHAALMQRTAVVLENSVATIIAAPKSGAKVVAATIQNTEYGYGGSFSYTINANQATGVFTGTLTFLQYQETSGSVAMDGEIIFSGAYNMTSGAFTNLNMSMNNLIGTEGSVSYSMTGTVSLSTSGTTKNVTMSVVLTDIVSKRTYLLQDFSLTLTGSSLTVSGLYYDYVNGYVVISTVTPLTVSAIDATPTSGQLLFTGSNGTKARLTFSGAVSTIEADTAGTGTYVVIP